MEKVTVRENIYSTDAVRGVYCAIPAGSVVVLEAPEEEGEATSVVIHENEEKFFELDVNSRKLKEKLPQENDEVVNGKTHIAHAEIFSGSDYDKAEAKGAGAGHNKVDIFLRHVINLVELKTGKVFVLDHELLLPDKHKRTTITLLGTPEDLNEVSERVYQGMVLDSAEYLMSYLEYIFKEGIPDEISVSSTYMVANPAEHGAKYILPINNLIIKL